MRSLLIICQKVDEQDDLLGFFVGWIQEFAKHFERVSVIAIGIGSCELPKNVAIYSCGKERNIWRPFRWLRFFWLLGTLVPRSSGVFAHMSPIFAVASWPLAALFGKDIVLWYLHRNVSWKLKAAEKLCTAIATADADSLNLKSSKVCAFGHGIPLEYFAAIGSNYRNHTGTNVLCVGRISRIKNQEMLLRAAAGIRGIIPLRVRIVGRPVMAQDMNYHEELERLCRTIGVGDIVEFTGLVTHNRIAEQYHWADIAVNMSPPGGLDKAVLEAMASGCIVLTSNTVFCNYFGDLAPALVFEHGSSSDLAAKLVDLCQMSEPEKDSVRKRLYNIVKKRHSLRHLIGSLSKLFLHEQP